MMPRKKKKSRRNKGNSISKHEREVKKGHTAKFGKIIRGTKEKIHD